MPSVADRDRWRIEALDALYTAVNGDKFGRVNYRHLSPETSIPDDDEAQGVFQWLVDHGLAEWAAMGGTIAITPEGVDQVEKWQREESAPPQPAAPLILNVVELRQLERFLSDVEAAVERGEGPTDPDDVAALDANRESLAAQQRSPRPDRGIVRLGLAAIGRMFEGGVGNVIGTLAVEMLKHLH